MKINIDYESVAFVEPDTFASLKQIYSACSSYQEKVNEWLFGKEFYYHLQNSTYRRFTIPPPFTIKNSKSSEILSLKPDSEAQKKQLEKIVRAYFYKKQPRGKRISTQDNHEKLYNLLLKKKAAGTPRMKAYEEAAEELNLTSDAIHKRFYRDFKNPYEDDTTD